MPDPEHQLVAVDAGQAHRDLAELQVAVAPCDPAELQVAAVAKPKSCLSAPGKRSLVEHQLVSCKMHLAELRKQHRRSAAQSQGVNSNYEYKLRPKRLF